MAKKKIVKLTAEEIQALENGPMPELDDLNDRFHRSMDEVNKTHLIQVNVAQAAEEYACLFGANKNIYRVTPSIIDGCRPGKRRMLYMWWLRNKKPTNTNAETMRRLTSVKGFTKVNNVMADTVKIHPHGDTGVYTTIVNEGQKFRNNVLIMNTQGNFGNVSGDEASAQRYIEVGMNEYVVDCFFSDFEDYCVPMKLTYDESMFEPEYLPAKYPHVLFNPQLSGIGYGFISNIVPFNVTEVLEATIKLMKNPDAKIMLIPDFQSGVDIVDNGEFKDINKTGKGKLKVQGSYTIDHITNTIVITSLPLDVYADPWISSVVPLCDKGGIFEKVIKDIRNNSDENNVKITLVLAKDANPEEVMDYLLKKTKLRDTHSVKIAVMEEYNAYETGIKELLLDWIEYRKDAVLSMFNNRYVKTLERQHMNDILIKMSSEKNRADTMKIAGTSKNRQENIQILMDKYKMTSLQAKTVVEMKIYQFNEDKHQEYKELKKKYKEDIAYIEGILDSEELLDQYIIDQLKEGIAKYGHPRHSRVISYDNKESEVKDTMHLVGISQNGYIKKIKYKEGTPIGSVGEDTRNLTVFTIGNRESIFVIDETGMINRIAISSIPNMKPSDPGILLSRFFKVTGKVITVLPCPSKERAIGMTNASYLMVTEEGYGKRVSYEDVKVKDGSSISIISLNPGDKLAKVILLPTSDLDVVICTNMGNGIRLPISDIKEVGRNAKGSRLIETKVEEDVTGLCAINPAIKHLLYITSSGKMKLTELKYFPVSQRRSASISLISLDSNEQLIGVASAKKSDMVKLYGKKGADSYDLVSVGDVPVRARASKGERILKLQRGELITGFKLFNN